MFKDRIDAGTQLSQRLLKYKNQNAVVLAIPRGGLPIGAIIAKTLEVPLDVVLSKKIGHPKHKEYAIGAVSIEDVIISDATGINQDYIEKETVKIRERLKELYHQYYKNRLPENQEGRTVIIVDDGIATGNTLFVTIALIHKQKPARIIVAIPVAPSAALRKLKNHPNIDEVVCILEPINFRAVGQFYDIFDQVSDQDAIRLLEENLSKK